MEHILKSIYSRKNWVELVHDIFGNSYKVLKNPLVEKADNHIAVAALCLGKIELSDGNVIAVYETQLQPNIQLSRNKVGIRNLLRNSWKLYDGALIGSYIEGSDEWRFSYISETKGFDAEGNYGNLKTQPKRFTYLFGKQHPCRTAKQRFGDLMNSEKTLENIKDAFSVEALSDEFFKDYKQQYEKFCTFVYLHKTNTDFFGKEFAAYDDKTVRDYVKKMLGRIVFLNFLQKKGWLGVPAQNKDWTGGDLNFMRSLYVNANDYQRDKFLDLVLEPLFFNCLNEKRAADLFDTKIERIGKVKIPYLNGGLFEKDAIDKPDSNFPADYFANLFDLFSQYNFTIDENDPNDAEVGVDPEMLGKIFENLLEDNKDKGAFYTPKEIVQYMCRESLIAYLIEKCCNGACAVSPEDLRSFVQTHQLPNNMVQTPQCDILSLFNALCAVKICDPAIGSGAFPMGLLNELFACRMALNGKDGVHSVSTDNTAEIKRQIIQNNIYGVDIEKGAVDIARLRFWLALVVDETEPQPLPNLDYKIMQGNSLLESYEGVDLSNIMQSDDMFVNKAAEGLGSKLEEYYNEDNHTTKAKLRAEIDNIVKNSIKAANPQVGDIEIPNDKFFLWHTYFADVFNPATDCNASGGFDIVIGNPPYGFRTVLTNAEKRYFRTIQNIEFKSGDSAELFVKISFDKLVKSNGILTFIIPKKSLYGESWEDTRINYWGKNRFLYSLDTGKSFENVLLEAAVFGLQKTPQTGSTIQLGFLEKDGSIKRFYAENFNSILSSANTLQIYSVQYKSIYDKVQNRKMTGNIVSGKLGLAIGTAFFSDTPKEYKLLKGIDATRYMIRSHRFLNNQDQLDWTKAKVFLKPKIICQRLVAHILYPKPHLKFAATYDDEGIIITNTLTSFELDKRIDDKFFIGYLNSTFAAWYAYNFIYCQAIRGMDLYNFYITQLVIPTATPSQQQPIIALVEKILSVKKRDPQANTTVQEAEIDKLVYELYGLTDDEIKVVEGK